MASLPLQILGTSERKGMISLTCASLSLSVAFSVLSGQWRSRAKEVLDRTAFIAKYLCLIHVTNTYLINPILVYGPSMLPTLNLTGDVLLIEGISPRLGKMGMGDVVVVRSPENPRKSLTKRILGMEGDKVTYLFDPRGRSTRCRTVLIDLYFKVIKTIALRVKRCETIKSLKAILSEKEGISGNFQELFFEGNILKDDQRLVECGINKNSTLHLYLQNLVGMKVFVKIPSKQETIILEVKTYETIQNVKTMIQTKEGIQSDQFSLFYAGKQLKDDKTLASLNIKSESTLYMVINPRDVLSIYVKTHAGNIEKLEVRVLYTVGDVKAIVCSMIDIGVSDAHFIYEGKELEESKTLAYYDVKHESILEILPPPVWIFVKTDPGKSVTLALELGDTVEDLKDKISHKLGLPVDIQRLFYAGRCLKEGKDLAHYDIQKDSTIHVRVFLSSESDNIEFSLSELGSGIIQAGTTIRKLKAKIQTRMPRQVKELYFCGMKLHERLTLAQSGIEMNSTVGVLLTSRKEK